MVRRRRVLEGLDQFPAATGIAGYGVEGDRKIRRQNAGHDQGAQHGDGGAGITAGIGHPLGGGDPGRLFGPVFGHAVDPVPMGPVGNGGIDQAGIGIVDHGDGLARGVFRQAQDGKIGPVEHLGPCRRVLAPVLVEAQELHVAPACKPVADLQARCARLAVDEYGCRHLKSLPGKTKGRSDPERPPPRIREFPRS